MLPVSAGFIFKGEEKNCEKLGSCAFREIDATKADINNIVRKNLIIF
jgi:hypothetical protein